MKKKTLLLLLSIAILSCNKTKKETATVFEKLVTDKLTDSSKVNLESLNSESEPKTKVWYDDLIVNYLKNSDNELIKIAIKNNDRIEWLLDRTEKTDSTNYYIFNIGQDVYDEGKTNKRFSSDGWLYIDSLSKKIYEYDLPNDSLIEWKNKHNLTIDTFSTFPPEIDGCSCYFSNNSTEFKKDKYIYVNDFAQTSFLKINGVMTKFNQTFFTKVNKTTSIAKAKSNNYEISIEVIEGASNGDETSLITGTIKLKDRSGKTLTKTFYGECGC